MSSVISISKYRNLIFLIILHYTINFQAQIENIPINEEVIVDRLYAGLLSNTNHSTNSNNLRNNSSVQFGTRIRIVLVPDILQIRSFGVFKIMEGQSKQILRSYEGIFTLNKNTSIHFGLMATPTTEIRPNPTTWQSQTETNAEKTIIGGRPGIKLSYNFNETFNLTYGLHNNEDNIGQYLKIQYKQLIFSYFIERYTLFFAAKWKFNQGNVLTTKSKDKVAISTLIPICSGYKFYADLEYTTQIQKLTYFDIGLRKLFPEDGLIKGFISISYNHQSESILGGLFIHI